MIRNSHWRLAVAGAAALLAVRSAPVLAQVREGTIDPGMTRAQVEERLGPPKVVRTSGVATYLFFANGCARTCGMDDLVVLEGDAVTDAVFRSPSHHYTGQSSSPTAVEPRASRKAGPRNPPGVTPIRSDSAMSASGRGGLVVGGDLPAPDSTDSRPATPRTTSRRPRRRAASGATAAAAAATTAATRVPAPAAQPAGASMTTTAPGAAPAASAEDVTTARNGQRSTTGPVDARAAVKNQGPKLYPSATPVRSPSSPADSSAARVPYQGAQLAPSDSDLRALRRATPPQAPNRP